MRKVLQTHLSPDDWQQHTMFGQSSLPIPALASLGHGHISLHQAEHHLMPEHLNQYYKFAFVRHPFDRFVSAATFLFAGDKEFQNNPTKMMKNAMSRPRFRNRILISPQSDMLINSSGGLGMDYIGRYETVNADFNNLLSHFDLPINSLPTTNTSRHAEHQAYLDFELTEQLREFYARDFALLGYTT